MNILNRQNRSSGRNNESGFTITEVMVSMTIFLMITGTVFGLLRVAKQSRDTIDNKVQLTKGNRIGLNLIGRDTYNAGYGYPVASSVNVPDLRLSTRLGTAADGIAGRDLVPPVVAGNNRNVNNFNTDPAARTDQVTYLFKDTTFNKLNNTIANPTEDQKVSQPLSVNVAANNRLTITGAGATNTICNVNDLLLIAGNSGAALAVVTARSGTADLMFNNLDILNFNNAAAGGPLTTIGSNASVMRVKMVTYFVSIDGVLTRREFANLTTLTALTPYVDEPLVYGVEDLQIRYLLNDGTVSDAPSTTRLQAVRQVQFTITMRTTELNAQQQPVRNTETTTFSTKNLGYDAN
jgi:type II secretory pathway component PulJ